MLVTESAFTGTNGYFFSTSQHESNSVLVDFKVRFAQALK